MAAKYTKDAGGTNEQKTQEGNKKPGSKNADNSWIWQKSEEKEETT